MNNEFNKNGLLELKIGIGNKFDMWIIITALNQYKDVINMNN